MSSGPEARLPEKYSEGAGLGSKGSGSPLTGGPFLVKVDRYGSVSGLVRVRVPLGQLVIVAGSNEAGSFEPLPSV